MRTIFSVSMALAISSAQNVVDSIEKVDRPMIEAAYDTVYHNPYEKDYRLGPRPYFDDPYSHSAVHGPLYHGKHVYHSAEQLPPMAHHPLYIEEVSHHYMPLPPPPYDVKEFHVPGKPYQTK